MLTRNRYMHALGIPVWMPKGFHVATPEPDTDPQLAPAQPTTYLPTEGMPYDDAPFAVVDVSAQRAKLLAELNTPRQPAPPPVIAPVRIATATPPAQIPDCTQYSWEALQQAVSQCQGCGLHKTRTQTVFGTGDLQARWMLVGEAPGADEDRQGEPFVGRAGKLLNNMLAAIGLPRGAVYIANTLKCRPPNNRDPKPDESAACRGYLERQIALVNPTLILVVGRIAAHNLLQTTTPLGRLRGTVHALPGSNVPVIVTYHPAYLLRQPAEKAKAWQDLQMARDFMHSRSH